MSGVRVHALDTKGNIEWTGEAIRGSIVHYHLANAPVGSATNCMGIIYVRAADEPQEEQK